MLFFAADFVDCVSVNEVEQKLNHYHYYQSPLAINSKVIVELALANAKEAIVLKVIKVVTVNVVTIKVVIIKVVTIKVVILKVTLNVVTLEAALIEAVTLTLKVAHPKVALVLLEVALRLLEVTLEAKTKVECLIKSQSSCFERLFIDFYQFPQCPFSWIPTAELFFFF